MKICPKCNFRNSGFDSTCKNCKNDISNIEETISEKGYESGYKIFNSRIVKLFYYLLIFLIYFEIVFKLKLIIILLTPIIFFITLFIIVFLLSTKLFFLTNKFDKNILHEGHYYFGNIDEFAQGFALNAIIKEDRIIFECLNGKNKIVFDLKNISIERHNIFELKSIFPSEIIESAKEYNQIIDNLNKNQKDYNILDGQNSTIIIRWKENDKDYFMVVGFAIYFGKILLWSQNVYELWWQLLFKKLNTA